MTIAVLLANLPLLIAPARFGAAQEPVAQTSYRAEVLADAPVDYWRLHHDWFQSEVAGVSGPFSGGPRTHRAGLLGRCQPDTNEAVFFDGYEDGISLGHQSRMNFGTSQDFTWEIWLQTDGAFPRQNGPVNLLVDNEPVPLGPYPYRLSIRNATNAALKGKVTFQRYDGARNPTLDTVNTVNDNKPHHVVAVKRGATMEVWIDGVLDSTTIDTTTASTTNAWGLYLGRKSTHVDLEYKGFLDEIAVYNYALRKARIETHYSAGKCPVATEPAAPYVSNLSPSDGASSATTTPTLSATYYDPNAGDDGYVEFEVYKDGVLVASNAADIHTYVQSGQGTSWAIPAGKLTQGTTYTWRARSFDGVYSSPWSSSPASRRLTIAGTHLTVDQWGADEETGRVDYTFRVAAAALNAPGDLAGPCYLSECYWKVETRHSNGAVEGNLGVIASGTLAPGTSSKNETVSGALAMEVTDIRTIVDPAPCYGCSQARTRYDSGWVKVADPYATGDLSMTVKTWERDPSGTYTFDLDLAARGAAQFGGPCAEKPCQWRVEARYESGIVGSLGSEQLAMGTWSLNESLSGTISGGKITDLKATLASMCDVNLEYWCWNQPESYTTGWMPVSDFAVADINVSPLAVALAARNINLDELCIRADEQARILRIPDATPSTSPHSVQEACQAASTIPMALKLMVATAGGTVVIGSIIITLDGDNPNEDAIAKVPSPAADVVGSAVGLPPSCLDDAQRALLERELVDGGWLQKHHAASDKHSFWAQAYKDLLAQHPWATDKTLGQGWNLMKGLPHRGNHPPAYHYWIYRNLEKALREATDWESFVALWKAWVTDAIRNDPTIVRWEWWRC